MVQQFLNRCFTLNELILACKPDQDVVNDWKAYFYLDRKLNPGHSNGRVNHTWLQQMICDLSSGMIKYGGQGKKASDCYVADMKTETKAFNIKDDKFHCAASSFFASNNNVPEYRRLMASNKTEARKFVFKHSYDKNDYYLLTGTAKLNCNFEEIPLILIEKKYLVECLEPNYIKATITKINQKLQQVNGGEIYG
tara:strand:- start:40 stop:624 length:585 start_codon:yes stop_codon:yes gene_type:complete